MVGDQYLEKLVVFTYSDQVISLTTMVFSIIFPFPHEEADLHVKHATESGHTRINTNCRFRCHGYFNNTVPTNTKYGTMN